MRWHGGAAVAAMTWMVVAGWNAACEGTCALGTTLEDGPQGRGCVDGDGLRHGPYLETRGGVRISEGPWFHGVRDGIHTFFHGNGGVSSTGAYVAGRQEGPWRFHDEAGGLTEEMAFRAGQRHGLYQRFHPNHMVAEEGGFTADRREGLWTWRYPHGGLQARGAYTSDVREGPWLFYASEGFVRDSGSYTAGQKHGVWVAFHPNGKPAAQEAFERGVLHGAAVLFHANGTPRAEGNNVHGQRSGAWTQRHDNGATASTGMYLAGEEDGPWTFFAADGRVLEEGRYERGVRRDLWRAYDPQGRVTLRLGALETLPPSDPRNVMLGVPRADGNVLVNLAELMEPGATLWIHQSIQQRVAGTLVEVREGNAFDGADARLDQRALGVVKPDRPLVMDGEGVARGVVVVTTENMSDSPLRATATITRDPVLTPALDQQLDALADAAMERTLRAWGDGKALGSVGGPVSQAVRVAVRKRGPTALTKEMHMVDYRMDAEHALLRAHVTYRLKGDPVMVLALDCLVEGPRVVSWTIANDESGWLFAPAAGPKQDVTPAAYETLFDHDNDGRPEVLRLITRAGVTKVQLHELTYHHPHMYRDPVLTDQYGF